LEHKLAPNYVAFFSAAYKISLDDKEATTAAEKINSELVYKKNIYLFRKMTN
jgi:hypothetical protein